MRLRFGVTLGLVCSGFAGAIAVACGIEEGGVVETADGSVTPDVITPQYDGGGPKDVLGVDTYLPPSCGDAAACLPPVPAGWQILTVLPDPDASCPANFNQADLQTAPKFDPGACGCACADTSDAGCPTNVTLDYRDKQNCHTTPSVSVVLDAGCTVQADSKNNEWFGVKPVAATGLSCGQPTKTGSGTGTPLALRVCQPTCSADYCGSIVNGAKGCIMANDDVPCPAQYTQKSLVGSAVDFVCNACPTCTAKSANCTVTVDLHGQSDCNDSSQFSVNTANVNCNQWMKSPGAWSAIATTITPPAGPFCSYTTVDPGGDAGFVGARTICCK
jgi:hypothetical protein